MIHRLWTRSRTSAVTHIPHHATVSNMHMLSDNALLCSSIQYGIVARSFPLTGKVVKGFLNALGMNQGAGFGNPNAEFMPDVTACSISSDGPTAHIIWGRRDGSLSIMLHPRTMDGARAATRIRSSRVEHEHRGAVNKAIFSTEASVCVTAGADGRAKIWNLSDPSSLLCLWTSPPGPGLVP